MCGRRQYATRESQLWGERAGDKRAEGGRLIEHPEFSRFSRHCRFRIRSCRPYRARMKGKVDRPVRHIRDNFFHGREFLSDDNLNVRILPWLDGVANVRIHGTLKEARGEPVRPRLESHGHGSLAPPSRGATARTLDDTD